jgi:hypothetical protein
MTEDALPVVVIIHDAWHTPTHYSQLIDKLCTHGFPTACPQLLTSHTEENCTSSFNDDCSMVYQLIFDLASDGHDIIAFAHGYGSFVSTEVLGQLAKGIRKQAGLSGGVISLVSLSGFLPAHGETLRTQFGGQWPDYLQQQVHHAPLLSCSLVVRIDCPVFFRKMELSNSYNLMTLFSMTLEQWKRTIGARILSASRPRQMISFYRRQILRGRLFT